MQKLCTKCKSEKEPSEFNKDASRKDGLHPYCRDCQHVQRQRYRANPEVKARESAYFKAYYADQKNKEKHAARMADYFKRNRGAYAVRGDKWRAKPENVAKILAYRRKPESIAVNKARQIAWRKENPEAVKAKDQRRAARKRGASGFHTGHDIKQLFVLQRGKCACCRISIKSGYHVDHIMPLARGGSNDKTNLQLLCKTCNLRKSAKHPVDFMRENGRLI